MPKVTMIHFLFCASFMESFRNSEYQLLLWICEHRTEFLTLFFFSMTVLGSKYLYLLLIPTFFACMSRTKAYSYSKLVLGSLILNALIKELFSINRPSPEIVTPLYETFAKGFSFPSGHAQMSALLGGLLIIRLRKSLPLCTLLIGIILSVSFSRLYLAAHFPTDIIGGWIAGLIILAGYLYSEKRNFSSPTILLILVCASLLLLPCSERITALCSTLAGLSCGMLLPLKQNVQRIPSQRFLALCLMFIGNTTVIFISTFLQLPKLTEFVLHGLWMSYFFFNAAGYIPLLNRK